jgi:hypothetical protein
LLLDSDFIGGWHVMPRIARSLVGLRDALKESPSRPAAEVILAQVASDRFIPGFGVAFRDDDERLPPLRRAIVDRHRRGQLEFWSLMEQVIEVIYRARNLRPNYALGFVAAFLDLGLSPAEIGRISIVAGMAAVLANAFEGGARPEPALQELPVGRVRYVGVPPRQSPAQRASEERSSAEPGEG